MVVTTTTKMMLPRYSNLSCGSVELEDCPVVLSSDMEDVVQRIGQLFTDGKGDAPVGSKRRPELEDGVDGGGGGGDSGADRGADGALAAGHAPSVLSRRSGFVFWAAGLDSEPQYKGRRCLGVPPEFPRQLIEAGVCDLVVVEADG